MAQEQPFPNSNFPFLGEGTLTKKKMKKYSKRYREADAVSKRYSGNYATTPKSSLRTVHARNTLAIDERKFGKYLQDPVEYWDASQQHPPLSSRRLPYSATTPPRMARHTTWLWTLGSRSHSARFARRVFATSTMVANDVVNAPTRSLNDCINACVDYNIANKTAIASGNNQVCNAVCWRNTDQLNNVNQIPERRFGFTTGNTSSGFIVTNETLCDSAAWINQRDL
ncbi:hypothetical protein F4678DRAFT_460433 [Xylaria arbuscula]|nr:hypothetical protein F4678DRAFT_460433 [Xylaria arbuscula]